MDRARVKQRKEWLEFSKSIGASEKDLVITNSWGLISVAGFIFDKPPAKGFYKSKHGEFYVPRAGTANRKAMAKMRSKFVDDVCKLLGIETFTGLSVITPGINVKGKTYYVTMPEGEPEKHCTRISDLEFEKLFPQKKKKKKRKTCTS